MTFESKPEQPEDMQNILRSAMNIVNDDFDYNKFMKAFAQNSNQLNQKAPSLSPQIARNRGNENSYGNESLKSCPTIQRPAFTFDETSLPMKENQQNFPQKSELVSTDKLRNVMNDNNIRRAITDMINKNGVNMTVPTLKLQITGNPNYDLNESDVLSVFSQFGNVLRIEIARYRTAYVVYDDIINALFAQKSLNNQYMRHLDAKFYVSWSNDMDGDIFQPEEDNRPINISSNSRKLSNNDFPVYPKNTSISLPNLDSIPSSFSHNSAKFTCKYDIQIETDKEFKIARKIIGPKGCNMKKIIEICQSQMKRLNIPFQNDFLKLRLRGQGSGFKEGPEQKESDDPLHLCVSSKYVEVYNLACKLVEDLLSGLYKEYEVFCQKARRPLQEPVKIKRVEIYNGNVEKKPEEIKVPIVKPRLNSIDYTLCANFSKSMNILGNSNSGHGSSNSLSSPSNKNTTSSSKQNGFTGHSGENDFKSSS